MQDLAFSVLNQILSDYFLKETIWSVHSENINEQDMRTCISTTAIMSMLQTTVFIIWNMT